jgi:phosphohistidine phosphatase SixA
VDLLLIRHAGHTRARRLTHALDRMDVRFDLLLHSPVLRAQETADALADHAGALQVTALVLEEPGPALIGLLRGEAVGVVGDGPWLGRLAALLTLGRTAQGTAFDPEKGGVVWLTGDPIPGRMSLRAALPPAILRRL